MKKVAILTLILTLLSCLFVFAYAEQVGPPDEVCVVKVSGSGSQDYQFFVRVKINDDVAKVKCVYIINNNNTAPTIVDLDSEPDGGGYITKYFNIAVEDSSHNILFSFSCEGKNGSSSSVSEVKFTHISDIPTALSAPGHFSVDKGDNVNQVDFYLQTDTSSNVKGFFEKKIISAMNMRKLQAATLA